MAARFVSQMEPVLQKYKVRDFASATKLNNAQNKLCLLKKTAIRDIMR